MANHGRGQYPDIVVGTQVFKVLYRTKVNIGGVIPVVRHKLGYWHSAFAAKVKTAGPVGKVWKGNDTFFTYPQHFINNHMGVMQSLQCMGHDHNIKAIICKIA